LTGNKVFSVVDRESLSERRRRLREQQRAVQPKPSAVSTVLAAVFSVLLGLFCLVIVVVSLASDGTITGPGWVIFLFNAITGVAATAGAILLILRRHPAIITATVGSVMGLLTGLLILIVISLPAYATSTAAEANTLVPYVLFGGLALVQVRRGSTQRTMTN
jgi:nitrate reductase gamma subunit